MSGQFISILVNWWLISMNS